jgi:hypothetical protein
MSGVPIIPHFLREIQHYRETAISYYQETVEVKVSSTVLKQRRGQ